MSEILKFVIVDENDVESDFEYNRVQDAIDEATRRGGRLAVVQRTYTYDDSELVWTSDGSDVWPSDDGSAKRRK